MRYQRPNKMGSLKIMHILSSQGALDVFRWFQLIRVFRVGEQSTQTEDSVEITITRRFMTVHVV